MALIIKDGRKPFPSKKRNRLLSTKEILEKITEEELLSITDLNVDTAFNVAWAGFMRMGELTYTEAEAKKATFAGTSLTKSDISFTEGDQYAILRLKQSKTDTEHNVVQIILVATGEPTWPVAALRKLFIQDPHPPRGQLLWPQVPQRSSPARSRPRLPRREYPEAGALDLQRLQALLYYHPQDTVQTQSQLPERYATSSTLSNSTTTDRDRDARN